jgi:molybdate transport system regulatory protein
MSPENHAFKIRSKIWIEDPQGKVIFGLGRYRILDAIRRQGSMQAAAKELRMSYRAVWMRVRSSERRLGKDLIVRQGKGSSLTPFAENLMKQFARLQIIVHKEMDEVYESLITHSLG